MKRKTMLLRTLAIAFVAAIGTAALAEEAAKIVDEKVIFEMTDDAKVREYRGIGSMRLSPDGTKLLYIRRRVDGNRKHAFKLVLRDIKAGKDKELKMASYDYDKTAVIMLSSNVFDPTGKRLALGIGVDANKDGRHVMPLEPMQAVLYDLTTDKVTKVGAPAPIVMASFDRTGKGLVLISADVRTQSGTMYTTPADKVKLRRLSSRWGLPRGICPAADVLALLLPADELKEPDERKEELVLFDLAKDKIAASLPVRNRNMKLDDYCPHWTADGRYLYYVGVDQEPADDGTMRNKYESRIWDRIKGKLAPEVAGMIPLGPGPTATTMVLYPHETRNRLVVHDAAADKTWTVVSPVLRPIGSEGKYVLFIKPGKDGKGVLCRGRIALKDVIKGNTPGPGRDAQRQPITKARQIIMPLRNRVELISKRLDASLAEARRRHPAQLRSAKTKPDPKALREAKANLAVIRGLLVSLRKGGASSASTSWEDRNGDRRTASVSRGSEKVVVYVAERAVVAAEGKGGMQRWQKAELHEYALIRAMITKAEAVLTSSEKAIMRQLSDPKKVKAVVAEAEKQISDLARISEARLHEVQTKYALPLLTPSPGQ